MEFFARTEFSFESVQPELRQAGRPVAEVEYFSELKTFLARS